MIEEAVRELKHLAPEFAERIYAEVKAEANTYTTQTECERIKRAIRIICRGVEPEMVYEMIKEQKEDLLEIIINQ